MSNRFNSYECQMLLKSDPKNRLFVTFFFFLHYRVHVGEADQCQLNLNVKCRPLQVHLKIAEEPKWRKEGNGTTELESDLFIVSFEGEIG